MSRRTTSKTNQLHLVDLPPACWSLIEARLRSLVSRSSQAEARASRKASQSPTLARLSQWVHMTTSSTRTVCSEHLMINSTSIATRGKMRTRFSRTYPWKPSERSATLPMLELSSGKSNSSWVRLIPKRSATSTTSLVAEVRKSWSSVLSLSQNAGKMSPSLAISRNHLQLLWRSKRLVRSRARAKV